MDISTLRKIVRQESPARIETGVVVSADYRGVRQVTVRLSGGRTISRPYMCPDNLRPGDQVVVAHLEGLDRIVVLGRILDEYSSDLAKHGVLAPPANLTARGFPMTVACEWETYPGEDLTYIVEESDDAGVTSTQKLVSRGSYYLHVCTVEADHAPETWYFRVKALRWLGDNNVQYSSWSSWVSDASLTFDGRYRTETELQSVANAEGASFIGIEDAGGYYDATEVEAALQELGGAADFPDPGNLNNVVVDDGTDWQSVVVAGDASMAAGTVTVDGLQGRDVAAAAPADDQALVWSVANSRWEPQDQSGSSGSGGGNPTFKADGALVVTTNIDGAYISPSAGEIVAVYIHCANPGTASDISDTIADVNLNDVTIFTTQGNRPTLAWNDADGVAKSGTPDVTTLAENDVLTVDIDQVATGAEDLSVVIDTSSSGGGGGGGAPTDAKYVVTEANATLTAEIALPQLGYYNPDTPPAAPGAYDDEFDDNAVDAAWSFSAGADESFDLMQNTASPHRSETIYHGSMLLQSCYMDRAFTPSVSQAFTVVAKFSLAYHTAVNESYGRLKIDGQTSNHYYDVRVGRFNGYDQIRTIYNNGAGAAQGVLRSWGVGSSVYVMITHDGAEHFSLFVSSDGYTWLPMEKDRTLSNMNSFTKLWIGVSNAGDPDPMLAVGFVRYFTTEGQYKIGKDM